MQHDLPPEALGGRPDSNEPGVALPARYTVLHGPSTGKLESQSGEPTVYADGPVAGCSSAWTAPSDLAAARLSSQPRPPRDPRRGRTVDSIP